MDEFADDKTAMETQPTINPSTTDVRLSNVVNATLAVFDAMVAILSGEDAIALASDTEEPADPMERLTQALDALSALEG